MQTFLIIILSALSLITLVAAFLLTRGLFPECVEKVQATLENNWKRSFWIGLLNTILISIFVFGLGALGNSVGLFYIPAFGIYGAFLIGLLFGLTAFYPNSRGSFISGFWTCQKGHPGRGGVFDSQFTAHVWLVPDLPLHHQPGCWRCGDHPFPEEQIV